MCIILSLIRISLDKVRNFLAYSTNAHTHLSLYSYMDDFIILCLYIKTTSKTPNYCLILYKLLTLGIAQASLALHSLNRRF